MLLKIEQIEQKLGPNMNNPSTMFSFSARSQALEDFYNLMKIQNLR